MNVDPQPTQPSAPPVPVPAQSLSYQPTDYQYVRDLDHLRLLAIFHYVQGGLTIAFSSIFIFHLVMGLVMWRNPGVFAMPTPPTTTPSAAMPMTPTPFPAATMGPFFALMGGMAVLLGWTAGLLTIYSGRCIKRRRRHVFSLIMAGVNCLTGMTGIALGVFTFIVLLRPSVRSLYGSPA